MVRTFYAVSFTFILGLVAIAAAAPAAHYRHHGSALLPDPGVTPGLVRTVNRNDPAVCGKGTTSSYRATTESTKKKVCALYGVVDCPKEGAIEIDHLVSLELGGADDIRNLWPEPADPKPGFHEKDLVEGWLNRQVCSGAMKLQDAQRAIAKDWFEVYREMQKAQAAKGGGE